MNDNERDQANRAYSPASEHVQQGDAARASLPIKCAWLVVRGLLSFFFRVRRYGLKRVPHQQVIICANHLGWADPFLILCYLRIEPRLYILGYSVDYVEDPGAKAFRQRALDWLGVMVPLHPDKPVEALRTARDLLARGGSLLIFPEGTYMGAEEGKLLELQPTAARLSQMASVPVLPIGISGTQELWFRKRLTLRVGKLIDPAQFAGSAHERMSVMTRQIERELRARLAADPQNPPIKLLRAWLTGLFYGEETFTVHSRRPPT